LVAAEIIRKATYYGALRLSMLSSYRQGRFPLDFRLIAVVVLGLLGFGEPLGAERLSDDPDHIDTRIVLEIGSLKVSAYNIRKNFSRAFAKAPDYSSQQSPKEWFAHFLAEQVLIADAQREGYLEHPWVVNSTNSMADYMLASSEGPYYNTLIKASNIAETELIDTRRKLGRRANVILVVFKNNASKETMLGSGFETCSEIERISRLEKLKDLDDIRYHSGPISWPFDPFDDFSASLEHLEEGRWLLSAISPYGVMVGYCSKITYLEITDKVVPDDSLRTVISNHRRSSQIRAHESAIIARSHIDVNQPAFRLLCSSILHHPKYDGSIDVNPLNGSAQLQLFSFDGPNGIVDVPIGVFIQHYNSRPIKQLGDCYAISESAIMDYVTALWDTSAARSLNLDQGAKFCEDRSNFQRYQALTQYEITNLLPQVHIDEATVKSRFQREAFGRNVPVDFVILTATFPNKADAQRFAASAYGSKLDQPRWHKIETDAHSGEFWGGRPASFYRDIPENTVVSVSRLESCYQVVARGKTLNLGGPNFAEFAPNIRAAMQRAEVYKLELKTAQNIYTTFQIRDEVDYQSYGVDSSVAPWSN
jgi:glutathione S-transferase